MDQLISRAIVGRSGEQERLADVVDHAASRRGGGLIVVGEAGIGKSRLRHELERRARHRAVLVLSGRATQSVGEPFQPLVTALQRGFADRGFPTTDGALAVRPTLSHLVPEWSSAASRDVSTLAISEALLRLLAVAARDTGAVLVIDDAHWADPDTLTVLEYLIDHAEAHGVQIVVMLRGEPATPAAALAQRLADRRAASVVALAPLSAADVERLVLSCLNQDTIAAELVDFVIERCDGIPFLVEELLAGLVRDGALVRDTGGWGLVAERMNATVPATLAASIERRVRDLGTQALQVLFAAALLGRRFDWQLLPSVTGWSEPVIAAALRDAMFAQLVVAEGDTFRFRHALTREHVVSLMVPSERWEIAAAALESVERAHPGVPGAWCDLAAELATIAGRPRRAAEHLLEAARRAGDRGALATAAAQLLRARSLLGDDDSDAALRVDAQLAQVHALAGRVDDALTVGDDALRRQRQRGTTGSAQVGLELTLARAALGAGQRARAAERVREARERADALDDPTLIARATSLAAQVAAEQGDLRRAVALAEQALAAADQPDVRCEAYETLGRCRRVTDVAAAEQAFAAALACAERHGLAVWRARALHELGTIDLFDTMRTERLAAARHAAIATGAPATAAVVDFHWASALVAQGHPAAARDIIDRSIAVAQRLGLAILAPALTVLARTFAHQRRTAEMDAAIDRAEQAANGDPGVAAAIWGNVRAMLALHEADRSTAAAALDAATDILRAQLPGEHFPHWGLWALLRTLAGTDAHEARGVAQTAAGCDTRLNRAHVMAADAIVRGREGDAAEAAGMLDAAIASVETYEGCEWLVHATWWLVAPAALADGWGDPITWLQRCVRWFDAHDHPPLATDSRTRLTAAGGVVPRRGRGATPVPDDLRRLGVTSREMDVLVLLADGASNRELADRLVLSPRTVEKHVSSLLRKTGADDRRDLERLGRRAHPGRAPVTA